MNGGVVRSQMMAEYLRVSLKDLSLTGVQETGCVIGAGAYGEVKEYILPGKFRCAGKKIHAILFNAESEQRVAIADRFQEECTLLSQLHHPRIVSFMGVYFKEEEPIPALLMELLPMSLYSALNKYPIPPHVKNVILHDVACGLCFLHGKNPPLLHRDLTTKNVLLTEDFHAKIADLGVAKIKRDIEQRLTKLPGNPSFMPPEAYDDDPEYGKSLDMFSYGVLMLSTVLQKWPNPGNRGRARTDSSEVCRRKSELDEMGADHPLRHFTEHCLSDDGANRPSAIEAAEKLYDEMNCTPHPFNNLVEMNQHLEQLAGELQAIKVENVAQQGRADNKGYLLAHSASLDWKQCSKLPCPRKHVQAIEHQGKVYIGSGYGRTDQENFKVYCYSLEDDQWEEVGEAETCCFAMAVFDGEIVLLGGKERDKSFSKRIQVLMPEGKFENSTKIAAMLSARAGSVAAALPLSLIVAGGYTKGNSRVSVVEVFNRCSKMWSRAADLPKTCAELKTAIADGDQWYLLGGSNQYGEVFTASLQDLSAGNNKSWTSLTKLEYNFSFVSDFGECLVAMGGEKGKFRVEYSPSIYVYNNSKGVWIHVGDLPLGLTRSAALVLSCGELLVIGGRNSSERELDTVYKCKIVCNTT